jgi:hypothetical protein
LAGLGELRDELVATGDEPLYGLVVTQVAQIAENGHEAFRLERLAVDVDVRGGSSWVVDPPIRDLVCEKGSNDIENAGDDVVKLHDMQSSRWNGE